MMACSLQSMAAESSVGSLYGCSISISCGTKGVGVSFETNSTTTADIIGCKDIILQEKVDGVWKDINISGGYASNASSYGASGVYTGAVKGRTYRAYCTHYATWGSTTKTLSTSTGEMVYN